MPLKFLNIAYESGCLVHNVYQDEHRPWGEFFRLRCEMIPTSELAETSTRNLRYYRVNYFEISMLLYVLNSFIASAPIRFLPLVYALGFVSSILVRARLLDIDAGKLLFILFMCILLYFEGTKAILHSALSGIISAIFVFTHSLLALSPFNGIARSKRLDKLLSSIEEGHEGLTGNAKPDARAKRKEKKNLHSQASEITRKKMERSKSYLKRRDQVRRARRETEYQSKDHRTNI